MNATLDFTRFISLLSSSSSILLVLFFLLTARQNIWAWVIGGLYVFANHSIMLSSRIMPVSSSTIYMIVVNLLLFLYGAFIWHKNGHRFFNQPKQQYFAISSLLKQPYSTQKYISLLIFLIVLLSVSILLKRIVFAHFTILIYALAIIFIADKKIEGWILLMINEILPVLHNSILLHKSINLSYFMFYPFNTSSIIIFKLLLLIYGFIYWKSKLNKEEEIQLIPLSSLFKTGLLSVIYIVVAFVTPFLLTYLVCMGGTGCSGIPAGLFLGFFYILSFIIAAIILLVKKEHFKQWQLFFLANGLLGISVLQLISSIFNIIR